MIEITEQNRFSRFLSASEMPVLEAWLRWFRSCGVPARIYLGESGFALYREGLVESEASWRRQTHKPMPYGHQVDGRMM